MIDDPNEVAELLRKMDSHLPIPANVTPELAKTLRGKIPPQQQTVQISVLEYAGDEGGIVCGISPPDSKEAVLVSLTHLRIPNHHPLAKDITAYQNRRVRQIDTGRPKSSPFSLNLKSAVPTFEEEYEDHLKDLETGIVEVYRENPTMSDFDVLRALEAAINRYVTEQRQRTPRAFPLRGVDKIVYEELVATSELLLGRDPPEELSGIEAISLDEIIQCLKRVEKSVQRWNKQGGNQGYLRFVSQHIPQYI